MTMWTPDLRRARRARATWPSPRPWPKTRGGRLRAGHAPAHPSRPGRPPGGHGGHDHARLRGGHAPRPGHGRGGPGTFVRAAARPVGRPIVPGRRAHRPQREPAPRGGQQAGGGHARAHPGRALQAQGPRPPARLPAGGRRPRAPRGGGGVGEARRLRDQRRARPRHQRQPARDDRGLRRALRARRRHRDGSAHVSRDEDAGRSARPASARRGHGRARPAPGRVRGRLPHPPSEGALLRAHPAEPHDGGHARVAPPGDRRHRARSRRADRRGRRARAAAGAPAAALVHASLPTTPST